MKRFLNIIMVISACMVLAVSCKEEDNVVSEFSIDKTEIAVGADGGSELLEIKGNVKWQGTSESSWLKFSPSNGEGAATCEVLVDSSVVAEPREGVITFMAAGQTTATTVKVMQMGYAKGVFVSEEDRTISVENSAKLEERFFEVTMMANVNFDVRVNNLPAEDGTVSDKEWLKYKKETPNYDYGDRPRLLKLHFDWEINMTEKARTAEVIITPQETSDTEGDGTIKLVVTQKPAPVITDDRAGDSLALLSIYSSMNGIFTWDASENMRYWKGVELWEATDKYIELNPADGTIDYSAPVPEDLIGRLKSVEFIAFETKESLPYQVKYLKTAESITFSGNSNTFLKDIVLGNEICELVKYGNLRKLAIRAYGLVGLPENFTEFGKTLVSLDLGSNNFEVMGKGGTTIDGVKVIGIESITQDNFPYLRKLDLTKINRYDTTKDLSAYKGKDDKLGFRWTTGYGDGFPEPSDGYDNTYFTELLKWENLEYLSLSLNMLDGELPSDQDLLDLGIKPYTEDDINNAANKDTIGNEIARGYLIGAPKVWPRMKKLSLNLNFMNGKLPDWILYHPYLSFWDPFTMIFQQELSTTSSKAKNTKGEVITKFSNEPTNLSNYGEGKTSYYEMYPLRTPQITDDSEEGN